MPDSDAHLPFLRQAIALARQGMETNQGGPFGALVVRHGEIIGSGYNQVLASHDPTAHAEVVAIRDACRHLGHFQLDDCILYSSCEPCPMCLGAIYWARPRQVVFAGTREDAAAAGFDDDFIYRELPLDPAHRQIPMRSLLRGESLALFHDWLQKSDRTPY